MPKPPPSGAELAFEKVNEICLDFPGVETKLSHGAPSFFLRGKMFLNFVDDHHGDGRLAVWCKSTRAEQQRLVADDPQRYFVPPYVGVSGWVGVRLDLPHEDWIGLAILVEAAWTSLAPKRLTDGAASHRRARPLKLPTTDPALARDALAKLTAICLALPETTRERAASHATYYVRTKAFAHFLDNHHGDEIIAVAVRGDRGRNAKLVASDPKRFYLPAYIGPKGWLGVRLDRGRVDWEEVANRLAESYARVAPARLARAHSSPPSSEAPKGLGPLVTRPEKTRATKSARPRRGPGGSTRAARRRRGTRGGAG